MPTSDKISVIMVTITSYAHRESKDGSVTLTSLNGFLLVYQRIVDALNRIKTFSPQMSISSTYKDQPC
jgi:hypothetical protein